MFKCLVSGGCSFAYGFNMTDKTKRYSALLAKKFNIQLIDVSSAGASNDFIASSVAYGIKQALEKFNPDEILVMVGWTSIERFEYFKKSIGRVVSGLVNLKQHRFGDNIEDFHIYKFIGENLYDHSYGYYRFIHSFNYIFSLCKGHGIKNIFFNNIAPIPFRFPSVKLLYSNVRNENLQTYVLSAEAKKVFMKFTKEESFQDLLLKNEKLWLISNHDSHPNELAHQYWASFIEKNNPEIFEGILK